MAAGMHDAIVLRGIVDAGFLDDRQGIQIGTQADGLLPRPLAANDADDPGSGHADIGFDPPFPQLVCNKFRGAILFQAELGMGVDIAANGDQFVEVRRDMLCRVGAACGHVNSFIAWLKREISSREL